MLLPILAIENNAVMNVGVQVSLHSLAFNSLEIYTEVDLLDHVVILFLRKGNTILFSIVSAPTVHQGYGFSTFSPPFIIFTFF